MDDKLTTQTEFQGRDIYSPGQKKYSVYLPKYGITVQTALTDAREIMFSTEISALKQSRDLYFALGRMGESKKDFTNGFFKQAAKGLGATAVNMAGNLYGAAVNLGWKGVNAAALQWTRANKAAEVSTPEELALATKVDKAKYEEAERAREAWTKRQRADLQDFMQKAGLDKNQFDGFIYDLIAGGGTAVSALAVGAITKSPGAVVAMFGAISGQDYYGEALEAGLKGDKALAVGFGAGALEGLLEMYGTEQLFKAMASSASFKTPIREVMRFARQKGVYGIPVAAARGAVSEGAEEFAQNIASSAVMNAAGVRDDSFDEIIAESFYGAVLGAITGGTMAGAGRAAALAASKLEKAGMPKETAKEVAGKIIELAYEKESIEEAIKLAESENSPLTYENSDKAAAAKKFGEQVRDFANPEKRARAARQAWNIRDAVLEEGRKAGLDEGQAAMVAQVYQSAANMFNENTGVMPKDWWEQYRLEIKNNMQKRADGTGKDRFYQAAMYKNPAKSLAEFAEFYQQNKENPKEQNKSFYRFSTSSGAEVDVPFNRVKHIDKRHRFSKEQWDALESSIDNLEYAYYVPGLKGENNGVQFLCKISTPLGKAGVTLEVLPNGRILLDTAVFDSEANIDNWAKNEPLQRPSHKKPVLVGSGINNSISGLRDFVKTDTFYQAAMYKNKRDIIEFVDFVKNGKIKHKTYAEYVTPQGNLFTLPSDTVIHARNGHILEKEDWQALKENFDNIVFYTDKRQTSKYDGYVLLGKMTTPNGNYGIVAEYFNNNEEFKITTFFKDKEATINNWIKQKASDAPQNPPLQPVPLKQTLKSRLGDNLASRPKNSIAEKTAKNNGNDTFYQGAYHGTPHRFDEFSLENIGTGEGAQAHGWGLYFAQDRNISEGYRIRLVRDFGNKTKFFVKGEPVSEETNRVLLNNLSPSAKKDLANGEKSRARNEIEQAINLRKREIEKHTLQVALLQNFYKKIANLQDFTEIKNVIKGYTRTQQETLAELLPADPAFQTARNTKRNIKTYLQLEQDGKSFRQNELDVLEELDIDNLSIDMNIGKLFKVDIPENDVLLDEDKPFSEQPQKVKKALKELAQEPGASLIKDSIAENERGRSMYRAIMSDSEQFLKAHNEPADYTARARNASELLNAHGIKGITYDGAEDGRCYVIFDDKAIDIVETYYQRKNKARASVSFTPQGVFMELLENADPSSIVHETAGHVLLRNVEDIKGFAELNGGAREDFNEIWEDLEKWLGPAQRIEENGKIKYRFSEEQQEMFAEGMEKMFAAGKAPTGTLEKVFKYFREMLRDMYNEARQWLNLRPEVEDLFGRILAGSEAETADSKKYAGRSAEVKAVAARARKGEAATINGIGIKEVKALIKQLGKRRPGMPKEDLLTVLKRKGADYGNAGKIDAEAYANAGIKDKKGGIQDKPALWLKEEGFAADISEEEAWTLIEKALNGEKVYRPEDMERIAAVENFDANIEAIREAFGGNIQEAEATLRAIEDLEAKGYRIIGNSDVEYAQEQTGKLLSYAERERELKKKIAKLTEDKEELGNIAERRLKEISRRADLAREEGYQAAIKDAQDEKTVKDLLEVEREAQKNALDARRVKNALIGELSKRELAGKEELLKGLKEANGAEEINEASQGLIKALHKVYEQSEEYKADRRKTDLPATNWGKVKLAAIANFRKVQKQAGEELKRAQALEEEAARAKLRGIKLEEKKLAELASARDKVLKGYALKYARALKEAFAGLPHIDAVWLDKAANAIGREYAGRSNIIGRPLDNLIERAQREQSVNYKRYIGRKIEEMIKAGYKVKDGQKQKGKYDYATNKLFEGMARIMNMDKTSAKEELSRRRGIMKDSPSPAEAALKIFELNGDAESISADFVENMKFETSYLAFKAEKMSDTEMALAKESLAEQGLPDDIGEDRWHNVTPEFLSNFYEELRERRKAALEGRLTQSAELAFKVREEREAYAKAVRENGKAGFLTKGYINHVANWESANTAVANKETAVKYSLLNEEAQAEVRTSEKMKEIVRQVSETLGAKDAKAVKRWFDGLDEDAGVWQNRIESKRMALQEAAPAVKESMEAVEKFRKLLSGKEEIILKDFLSFTDAHGEKKNHNLKIVFDGKDGGLKSIFEEQGYDGVMKAVHAALKGLIVKNDGNTVFIRVRNDFAAVLKYSNPGGKGTYTLIDYAIFDENGKQTGGYGIRVKDPINLERKKEIIKRFEENEAIPLIKRAKDRKTAIENINSFQGKELTNKESGIKTKINRQQKDKLVSNRALGKSLKNGFTEEEHFSAVSNINVLYEGAFLWKKRGDRKGDVNVASMQEFYAPIDFDNGKKGCALILLKESTEHGVRLYTAELQEIKELRSIVNTLEEAYSPSQLNNSLTEKEAEVNSKETAFEVKKAALSAAQNALNPYIDGLYKPVAQKLTKGQIIDIYNMAKNPVGYARLENQYGSDQLTEMFSLLSKEDKEIADHWQKTVEDGHGEINKVFIKQYGLDMGHPAKYWPFSVDRITSEIDMLAQNYAEARRPGLTKTRTSGQLVEMQPMNPVEKLYKHYGRAMQYVHTAEKVSWLRLVLRDSKIKKTIEEHFGEDAAKTLYELLDNSTMGLNKSDVKHYEDGIMNWLTNNYVKAAIAAKPSIALKQLISVVNYAENMPAGQWAEGFVKALGDFKNTIDFMMQDPYLKTRWENGTQNEALMRALAQDFGKTKGVKALNSFTNILAINVRLGDIGAIIYGGKPYIDYLMNVKGMSKEEAFKQFRLDTLRSQQASQRSSLSRLQAKEMNWLMRALFAFKNTGNQYVRKIADAIIMYKRGEIDAKQLAKTIAIYAVINQYLYVAATSLGMLGAAYAGFDDEDKNREMLAEFMIWPAQNFGFLPILDDAVNQASYRLTNLVLGGKSGALRNPEVPLIKDVYDAVRSLGKEDLTFEDWVNAAAPVAQTATGLPVKYFAGAAKTPYELSKGNFTKTALILGGWSEKRAGNVSGD